MNRVRTRDRGWVRAITSGEEPAVRLLCFPHSGGSAATFRGWAAGLPEDVQLLAVQYPGHGDRIAEDPAGGVAEMASAVAAELGRFGPADWALFGHSFGSLVAYETARVLQDDGRSARALFVSGARAPRHAGGGTTHRRSDDELWAAVRELGGIEPEIADDPDFRELLLPALRSDITLHETYAPDPHAVPLTAPVHAYHNTEDPLVDAETVARWASVAGGEFSTRAWPGGHFAFAENSTELIADLVACLAENAEAAR
ncbi:thioesterase II family protein [Actinokineospora xionganensis]|uniref:Thioesterase n=1 Tax=Actinokineospora xionganensis TaxID=2684470 RepID=A0ABR7L5A7_9PSEU|nr:alpha/beta fold hydrolase [Actinokineospora xionganensis]MBC6447517.1 thioesterase [Actinokineospora xionganensis]